eukprot:3929106-Rhodomonas_salina.1
MEDGVRACARERVEREEGRARGTPMPHARLRPRIRLPLPPPLSPLHATAVGVVCGRGCGE